MIISESMQIVKLLNAYFLLVFVGCCGYCLIFSFFFFFFGVCKMKIAQSLSGDCRDNFLIVIKHAA